MLRSCGDRRADSRVLVGECQSGPKPRASIKRTASSRTYIRNLSNHKRDNPRPTTSSNNRQKGNTDTPHRTRHHTRVFARAAGPNETPGGPRRRIVLGGTGQRYASADRFACCQSVRHPDSTIPRRRSDDAVTLTARPAAVSLPQHHIAEKTSSIKESSRTSSAPAASVSKRLSTSSLSAPSSGAAAPLLAPLTAAG